jgi:hypothetical protein
MNLETATFFKKIIRQILRITIFSNGLIGLALLFISFAPVIGYFYLVSAVTTIFFIAPLSFVLLIYSIYKTRRKESWFNSIKKEVFLLLWALVSLVFYYTCLYIGTEII